MTNNQFINVVTLQAQDFLFILEVMEETSAENLRKVCGYYGDEKKAHLKESSEILFSMGRLYMKKAEITKGIEQKLNFIKAAALLHGAKVRFEKFAKNTSKKLKVIEVLNDMEKVIMAASGGKIQCRSLLETSKCIAMKFQHLRDVERENLKMLEIIDESVPEDEAKNRRLDKISLVRKLLKQNSDNYTELMCEIAREILQIFGFPPCEFAIAGLGSLAREEITLYSDFEHVIILEEGVQKRKYFENVREYFRWFSILFHIIVIGVGETILPNVGIRSLNDRYSGNKTKNWFFDSYTPAGVSFDGMMPHACKTPLGRQQTTERKKHIVELIQPVSEMLKYLSSEEDLKNGYCLKDVLYQSCFVFGSRKVYNQFESEALICDCEPLENLSREARLNINGKVRGDECLNNSLYAVDCKYQLYRPISTLICYLARFNGFQAKSGFVKIQLCRELASHQFSFMWALSVACEIRLKLYSVGDGNMQKVMGSKILKYIGKDCLINCVSAITDLSRLFMRPLYHSNHIFRHWTDTKYQMLCFLGEFSRIRNAIIEENNENENPIFHGLVLPGATAAYHAFAYFREATVEADEAKKADLLKIAERILLSDLNCRKLPRAMHMLAGIWSRQEKHVEALGLMEKLFEAVDIIALPSETIFSYREDQVEEARLCRDPADMIKYCKRHLAGDLDFPSRLMFGYALARSQFEVGEKEAGRVTLEGVFKLLATGNNGAAMISKLIILRFIHDIFILMFDERLIEDCYATLEMAEDIITSGPEEVDVQIVAPQFSSLLAVIIHILTAVYYKCPTLTTKLEIFEKAARICSMPKSEVCEYYYCIVLRGVVLCSADSFRELNIHSLINIISKAPKGVRNDGEVKASFITKFTNLVQKYLASPEDGGLLECLTFGVLIFEVMCELHPLLAPFLVTLDTEATEQLLNVSIPLISRDLYCKCPPGYIITVGAEYFAKSMLRLQWLPVFRPEIQSLWRSLFGGIGAKQSIMRVMMKYIYGFLCLRKLAQLRIRAVTHIRLDANFLPNYKRKSEYCSALDRYNVREFEKSAHKFWRIIMLEKMGSSLQRRSIIYLNWAIIQILFLHPGYWMLSKSNVISITDGQFEREDFIDGQKFWQCFDEAKGTTFYCPGFYGPGFY